MQTPWWNSEIEKAVGQLAMEGGGGRGKGEGSKTKWKTYCRKSTAELVTL